MGELECDNELIEKWRARVKLGVNWKMREK